MMTHCLFSISYAGLWGQHRLDLLDFIDRAAELGYDGVMIAGKRPHLSPIDATPPRIGEIRKRLEQAGMKCPVLGGYTDFSGKGPPMVPVAEMQINYIEQLGRVAGELGAQYIRVFSGYERDDEHVMHTWLRVVECLQECADRVARYGVTLAVQNHHDIGVHTDAMAELLADIGRPNVKLGFDAWNVALRGEDLYQAARRMAPHTVITTNADYVKIPRARYQPQAENYQIMEPPLAKAVPFGEGFIDYDAFYRGLVDGGFSGVSTYEMCAPLRGGGSSENLDESARKYMGWMRERKM